MEIEKLMAFENGELNDNQVIELFSDLVKSQLAWSLQGFYGRTARDLIKHGYLDIEGNILTKANEE